jgi:hypothetical protein
MLDLVDDAFGRCWIVAGDMAMNRFKVPQGTPFEMQIHFVRR